MGLVASTLRAQLVVAMIATIGCAKKAPARPDADVDDADVAAADSGTEVDAADGAAARVRSRDPSLRGPVKTLAAAAFHTSVLDVPEWPESDGGAIRLGYLRSGSTVEAYEAPLVNEECTDGWYELVGGGYVCGKGATFDRQNPRVRLAPKNPDVDAGMPYRYGVNLVDGTPLYRRVLKAEDRKKYEPTAEPKPSSSTSEPTEKEPPAGEAAPSTDSAEPATPSHDDESRTTVLETPHAPRRVADASTAPADAGASDAGKPKLKDLRGRGVLVRKMARGFYLALDRDFRAAGARWWRTTYGFAVPFERIQIQRGVTTYSGKWFPPVTSTSSGLSGMPHLVTTADAALDDGGLPLEDGGTSLPSLQVAFVNSGSAHELRVSPDGKKVAWGPELPKRRPVLLVGASHVIGGVALVDTTEGFSVRPTDVTFAKPAIPADVGSEERWIDVDLTRQTLVAFRGTTPEFATLVSSGRRDTVDKERDFPTPTGTFRIREKHVTTTMDGDVASDGPYSIEDVPWVMYFQGSYALHGAFWHDQFGHKRSHGCVNLSPEDARTLFAWSEPRLPEGWHGVNARNADEGTRVVIHEDPPAKK
ncbi:MAG: L,D-transpeptidase family protein [Polyangiaceae bacterium]